jgi:hypothetical protein
MDAEGEAMSEATSDNGTTFDPLNLKFQPLLDAVVDLLRDQRRSEWWNDRISVDERHIADLEDACHALKIDWGR